MSGSLHPPGDAADADSGAAAGALPSLPNLRDLGGHRAARGRVTRPGVVLRSEAPALATPADAAALHHRLGVGHVVDLRTDEERRVAPPPESLAVRVTTHEMPFDVAFPPHEPAAAGDGLTDPVTVQGRFYAWLAQRNTGPLRTLVELVADAEQPVLIHCAIGKDRTGVAAATLLLAAGVHPHDVVADYTRSEEPMWSVLPRHDATITAERIASDVRLQAPAGAMHTCLAALVERCGSLEGFLAQIDPDGDRRRALRRRLLQRP